MVWGREGCTLETLLKVTVAMRRVYRSLDGVEGVRVYSVHLGYTPHGHYGLEEGLQELGWDRGGQGLHLGDAPHGHCGHEEGPQRLGWSQGGRGLHLVEAPHDHVDHLEDP